jgi:hypothetical protein
MRIITVLMIQISRLLTEMMGKRKRRGPAPLYGALRPLCGANQVVASPHQVNDHQRLDLRQGTDFQPLMPCFAIENGQLMKPIYQGSPWEIRQSGRYFYRKGIASSRLSMGDLDGLMRMSLRNA